MKAEIQPRGRPLRSFLCIKNQSGDSKQYPKEEQDWFSFFLFSSFPILCDIEFSPLCVGIVMTIYMAGR